MATCGDSLGSLVARRWQGLEGQSRARGLDRTAGTFLLGNCVERRREHLDGGYVFDYLYGALRRLAQRLQPHQTNAGAAATSATASTKHLLSRVASGAPFLQARQCVGRVAARAAAIAKKQIRRLLTNATPRYDGLCAAAARFK